MIRFTLPDVNGKPFSNRAGLEILGFFCGDPIVSILECKSFGASWKLKRLILTIVYVLH